MGFVNNTQLDIWEREEGREGREERRISEWGEVLRDYPVWSSGCTGRGTEAHKGEWLIQGHTANQQARMAGQDGLALLSPGSGLVPPGLLLQDVRPTVQMSVACWWSPGDSGSGRCPGPVPEGRGCTWLEGEDGWRHQRASGWQKHRPLLSAASSA